MQHTITARLASIIDAFAAAFNSAFGGDGPTPPHSNAAYGGLAMRLAFSGTARTRRARDIAGTLLNEITQSQSTLSSLKNSLVSTQQRNLAGTLQHQLSVAQTTLAQLMSVLP